MAIYPGKTKGTYRVVIWAPREPGGKSKPNEKIVEGTSKDARLFEAKWRIDLQRNSRREYRGVPTFENFCVETYKPHIKAKVTKATWDNHYRWGLVALCAQFGAMRIADIGPLEVESYQDYAEGKPATINGRIVLLKSVLKYAHKRHGIAVQDISEIEPRPDPKGRLKAWTLDECDRLLAAAREKMEWLVPSLIFGLNSGCRKGEIVACEWSWIDLKVDMIRIPVNDYWRPKNGKPREVPIAPALRAVLTSPRAKRHARWVFPSNRNDRFAAFPDAGFAKVLDHAGLDGSPHWMRHTFASTFLQERPDLILLAALLGHSATYVTELYGHMLPDHLARARGAVNIGAGPKTVADTLAI